MPLNAPHICSPCTRGRMQRKRREDKGGKGGCCFFRNREAKKKHKLNCNHLFFLRKEKTLTQSGHKTQRWFEPSVNHKTNLRLKYVFLKNEQNEEQWGSPSFVCEPAWLGFSTCISRLLSLFFTALKQVDDKNINLSRLIVWHAYFDTLPSQALYSIITHSYSLPDAARMNKAQKGAEGQVRIVAVRFCYNHVLIGLEWGKILLYLLSCFSCTLSQF